MTLDLEDRLRTSLHDEADRAPMDTPEWHGRDHRRRPRRQLAAAAASIVAVATGLLAVVATRRDGGAPMTTVPTSVVPRGEEYMLERVSPDDVDLSRWLREPVRPGSVDVATWQGRTILAYTTVGTYGRGIVVEDRCVYAWADPDADGALGTCFDTSREVPFATPTGSWWGWFNVPEETAFVQYQDGDVVYWQRPMGGFVIFPDVAGLEQQVVAVDDAGVVVARADHDTIIDLETAHPNDMGFDNLGIEENEQVWHAAVGTMQSCLDWWRWSDPLTTDHPDAEIDQAWESCLAQSRTATRAVFESLGGEPVDDPADDPGVRASSS